MTINFNEMVSLESILYDPFYDTSESASTFYGFPTMLNVYAYINDGQKFTLNATFKGNPVYPWTRIQFPFKYNLLCKKLKLEFITVTSQKINGLNQNPACAGLFFIGHVLPKATTSIFNPTSIPDQFDQTSTLDQINPTSIPDQINPISTSNQFKSTSIEASIIQTTSIDDININDADDRSSKEWNVMILAYCIIPIFVVVIIVFIVIKIKMRKKIYNMDQNRNIY